MTLVVLAACAPILLVLLGCLRGFPGWQTSLLTLVATVVLATAVFHTSLAVMGQAMRAGLFTALLTVTILGPALFLAALMQRKIEDVSALVHTSSQRPLLVLFLVLGLSPLLESVCGFGTGIVICVPLYLALGVTPQNAAFLGLVGEHSTAYASMGNALGLEANVTGLPPSLLGMDTALFLLPWTCGCAILALLLIGGTGAVRRWGLVALGAAILLVWGEWMVSRIVGVEIAGLLSSIVSCGVLGGLLGWHRSTHLLPLKKGHWRAWGTILLPLLLLSGGQLLMREIPALRSLATRSTLVYGTQHLIVALHPGVWLGVSCLIVMVLLRKDRAAIPLAWKYALNRGGPLATMVVAFLLASSLMQVSGMIAALSSFLPPLPGFYLDLVPLIGALGGWITGSNVASNALFAVMQNTMARQFHLSPVWIGATQNAAASFGRLLAPSCLFLTASAARVREHELFAFTLWLVALALVGATTVLAIVFSHTLWITLVEISSLALLFLQGCLRHFWLHSAFESGEPGAQARGMEAGEQRMLTFALIGAGAGVFRHHREALMQLPGQIVALADTNPSVAGLRAQELGCSFYTDYQHMLTETTPDVAVILTPSFLHASMACACLEAGCHVLVEKPLALQVAEADAMIATARRCKRLLGVVFQHRYRPEIQEAHRLLQKGAIGELQHIQVFAPCPRPLAYYGAVPWRGSWSGEGGGVIMNQAPHVLDVLCFLVGRPERVFAWTRHQLHQIETEDTVQAQMEWANGMLGSLCASTSMAGEKPGSEQATITITGTSGSVHIQQGELTWTCLDKDMRQFVRERLQPFPAARRVSVPLQPGTGHLAVYRSFCDALQGKGSLVSGQESLEVGNALILSGQSHQVVELPVDRKHYASLLQALQQRPDAVACEGALSESVVH